MWFISFSSSSGDQRPLLSFFLGPLVRLAMPPGLKRWATAQQTRAASLNAQAGKTTTTTQ
jgi:hypothetical protein